MYIISAQYLFIKLHCYLNFIHGVGENPCLCYLSATIGRVHVAWKFYIIERENIQETCPIYFMYISGGKIAQKFNFLQLHAH